MCVGIFGYIKMVHEVKQHSVLDTVFPQSDQSKEE